MTDTPSPQPEIAALLRASLRRVISIEQHCSGVMRDGVFQPRAIQSISTVPINGGQPMTMSLYWDHDSLAHFVTAGIELLEELGESLAQAERFHSAPIILPIPADAGSSGPVGDLREPGTTGDLGTLAGQPDGAGEPGAVDQPGGSELS